MAQSHHGASGRNAVKAVLGPTNTGKTHLAIERLCAHSSGAIGFPLRLLAREVYDRVCAIKGERSVALITGEERIEPPDARWFLCTAEAMPVPGTGSGAMDDLAFVALDEAQLAADRERGHIFTDRLLHARGREETMILGSATMQPLVEKLLPGTEVIGRPRFSTLSHVGPRKLSRIPPRSAIVGFSAEQVYTIAEMLRRFRGGAAVVMGALSPRTRNAQVELFQSGEVDYLVATDAIGMGLNLDLEHVAFASLSKFDGVRQRRLTPAEMAQIAGRAGRHQRDGTFGTLAGGGGRHAEFTDEEVYAIEEHRFAPVDKLFWREAEPRFDDLATLIADLEAPPGEEGLAPAPEAIDLAVLKRLAEDPAIADTVTSPAQVARFWEACSLPDFRQLGVVAHAQFVGKLWQDLRGGQLRGEFVAQAIANLDNVQGDIDTLQGRIAAIRSWAYIAQRPDWVLAKAEMAERARGVEARLSDALHARLTERFINRRTSVLMRKVGPDAALLDVTLEGDDVLVEGEALGTLKGFAFRVDPAARHTDSKLLLAAAERHVPALMERRASELLSAMAAGEARLALRGSEVHWRGQTLARVERGKSALDPKVTLDRAIDALPARSRDALATALADWLAQRLAPLSPLRRLQLATTAEHAGPELRALLIALVEAGGQLPRDRSNVERLDRQQRIKLNKLGVRVGALDIFMPAMLKPAALWAWDSLAQLNGTRRPGKIVEPMPPVQAAQGKRPLAGYRRIADQWLRIDIAETLLREAHEARGGEMRKAFRVNRQRAISSGLTEANHARLLRLAGFRTVEPRPLAENAAGPLAPIRWRWRPTRRQTEREKPLRKARNAAFDTLAELVR